MLIRFRDSLSKGLTPSVGHLTFKFGKSKKSIKVHISPIWHPSPHKSRKALQSKRSLRTHRQKDKANKAKEENKKK
jgi:hypothetical protein